MLRQCFLTAFLALGLSLPVLASTLEGKVVGVSDGDTLTVLLVDKRQAKIRLAQIDAPEKKQDFGQAAKKSLSDMAFGKQVVVEYKDEDRYGRVVGKVLVDGLDVNLEQIKKGMAWVYRQYADDQAYYSAEEVARNQSIGIWSQPSPIPPWEFRNGGGKKSPTMPVEPPKVDSPKVEAPNTDNAGFSCEGKRFCREMNSCDEAKFYLNQCGVNRLDGDHDGVPCEKIC